MAIHKLHNEETGQHMAAHKLRLVQTDQDGGTQPAPYKNETK
jgi:hypothetical protein